MFDRVLNKLLQRDVSRTLSISSNFQARITYTKKCIFPANIYLFKVNKKNRKRWGICSKLTIKTPERGAFITLTYFTAISSVSIVDLEQANKYWLLG